VTVRAYATVPLAGPEPQTPWAVRVAPGLLLALLVAAVATVLGKLVPIVGGPVFGIVLGAIAAATISGLRAERWTDGYAVASKLVLQLSIVVLGTGLSLQQVLHVGGAVASGDARHPRRGARWRVAARLVARRTR
jgi:uncharacterized membrane protein YadS